MTPRISPHTQSPHTTIDYLAALTNCRISSGYLRIPCPAHGGTNTNLALWVNDEGIAARCHSAGCSYADIAKAIEDRYGISINPRRYHDNPTALAPRPTNARRAPGPGPKAQDLRPYALQLVAEYLGDDNEHWAHCLHCQQEISAQNGVEWRRVVRRPCPHCGAKGW